MWSLFEEHREELTTNKDLMVLKPDVSVYKTMEDCGQDLSLGLFLDDIMVGYSINFLVKNLHYSDLLVCQNDVIFISKPFRGKLGSALIAYTEAAAKQKGAGMVLWHAKPDTPLAYMLPNLGCKVQDIVYSKVL